MPKKLHYTEAEQKKFQQKLNLEGRPLFKKILSLDQPIGVTCAEFEKFIAEHYGKEKVIKPGYLFKWAGMPTYGIETLLKPIQKWLFAAAIDYLLEKKVNPITIISIENVIHYWVTHRKNTLSVEEAEKRFIVIFDVPKEKQEIVAAAILENYNRVW